MSQILKSILFSLRVSAKTPLNTLLCICVLSCGIALTTSMYKLYEMLYASTVPYENSDRMVMVTRSGPNGYPRNDWPIDSYRLLVERQHIFDDTLAFSPESMTVKNGDTGYLAQGNYVGANFSRFLNTNPILGRTLTDDDVKPDAPRTVLLSYNTWKQQYNLDPEIIGKTLVSDGVPRTIVGVMPEGFDGPFPMLNVDMWVPLNLDTLMQETGYANSVLLIAAVKKGLNSADVSREANVLFSEIVKANPREHEGLDRISLRYFNDAKVNGDGAKFVIALFVCAILVLLMSCGIVSGLMTARYSSRTQEIAVRTALGASRGRIVMQMFLEFLTISLPAILLGFLLSHLFDSMVLEKYYDRFGLPPFMRHHDNIKMTVFFVVVLFFVTLLSTLMPALRASRTDLNTILKESTRTGSALRVTRLSNFLITWQVATACIVLSCGAMIGYFIYAYRSFNTFFNEADYVTFRLAFNAHDHGDRPAKCNEVEALLARLRQTPGIEKAALTIEFFGGNQWSGFERRVWVDGKEYATDNEAPRAFERVVSPGYMDAFNFPLLVGRDFTAQDNEKNPVAIVTEGFARQHFGSLDVIGRRFKTGRDNAYLSIIGVIPEVYNPSGDPLGAYGFFRVYASEPWDDVFLVIKGRGSLEDLRKTVASVIDSVDSKICIAQASTFTEARDRYGPATFLSFLLSLFVTFSVCALLMTAGGLYGIISFSTNIRRTEMGIRLALGAQPEGLMFLVTRRGLVYVAIGLVLGAGGSILVSRILANSFSGGNTFWPYVASAAFLLCISGISVLVPAYSASRCEPSKALRD